MIVTWVTEEEHKRWTQVDEMLLRSHLARRGIDVNKPIMRKHDRQRGLFLFWNPEEKPNETPATAPDPSSPFSVVQPPSEG